MTLCATIARGTRGVTPDTGGLAELLKVAGQVFGFGGTLQADHGCQLLDRVRVLDFVARRTASQFREVEMGTVRVLG